MWHCDATTNETIKSQKNKHLSRRWMAQDVG
jgi:hypothetical protein